MPKYIYPVKVKGWACTEQYLPKCDTSPNEIDVIIRFHDGHKSLSDAGTVLRDAAKARLISHWMPIYNAPALLPDPEI